VTLCALYIYPNKTRKPEKFYGYEYRYNHPKPDGYKYGYDEYDF